jgi:hypothetical protein
LVLRENAGRPGPPKLASLECVETRITLCDRSRAVVSTVEVGEIAVRGVVDT